jgi:hypothetical protein
LVTVEDTIERMLVEGKVVTPGPLPSGGVGTPGGPVVSADIMSTRWAEGIAHSVLYTSVGLYCVSDFCKQAPGHFAVIAGTLVRPDPDAGRRLHDPAAAPSWQEMQGLGVPVAFHEDATGNNPFAGVERCKRRKKHPDVENHGFLTFAMSHLICHPHEQQIVLI